MAEVDVRFGSLADIATLSALSRLAALERPLCANADIRTGFNPCLQHYGILSG
jgi:hypothetical protein